MKRFSVVSLCLLLVSIGASEITAQSDWTLRKNADGIACYTKPQEGLDLDQFKGVGIVNARLETIASIFRDVPSYTQWMFNCREIKTLKDMGNDNLIVYYVNRSPWPVADRDAVVKTRVYQDHKNASGVVVIESTNYNYPSPSGRVRMPYLKALFILQYVDREHTRVIFDIKANPGGNIPATLVNAFTKDHPYHTIQGLRKMAAMQKYVDMGKTAKEFELSEKLFREKGK
jgi:hypothetical protein